ncbi:hypothetical protein U6B65_10725 [Oscillospiraceae bacterium MB08-C2-2]|nr:hypothetical protein U6B65_10725 [Oscillospiraceae bacterium MB08-C2-2]
MGLLLSKWKEIYCGTSQESFLRAIEILKLNSIKYKHLQVKHDASPPFRGFARKALGRVGEITESSILYYIYVNKHDFEKARDILAGEMP